MNYQENPMGVSTPHLRLSAAQTLDAKPGLWLDLNGNPYCCVARSRKEAQSFAKILRRIAYWIDTYHQKHFPKPPALLK
jgi:hypothetical protein